MALENGLWVEMAQIPGGRASHGRHAAGGHLSVRAMPEVLRHGQVAWQYRRTSNGIAQRAAGGV